MLAIFWDNPEEFDEELMKKLSSLDIEGLKNIRKNKEIELKLCKEDIVETEGKIYEVLETFSDVAILSETGKRMTLGRYWCE